MRLAAAALALVTLSTLPGQQPTRAAPMLRGGDSRLGELAARLQDLREDYDEALEMNTQELVDSTIEVADELGLLARSLPATKPLLPRFDRLTADVHRQVEPLEIENQTN